MPRPDSATLALWEALEQGPAGANWHPHKPSSAQVPPHQVLKIKCTLLALPVRASRVCPLCIPTHPSIMIGSRNKADTGKRDKNEKTNAHSNSGPGKHKEGCHHE